MSTIETSTARFQRRPDARPDELLDAALAVFGEKGFRASTLEEVAARAGVSKGTIYLYFTSKEELFRTVVEQKVVAKVEAAEEETRAYEGPITPLLTKLITRMWCLMSEPTKATMMRIIFAELPQFPALQKHYYENVIQRHHQLLRDVVARGVASGEFRKEAIDLVPMMIPALVVQLHQRRSLFANLDIAWPSSDVEIEMVLSLMLHGISNKTVEEQKVEEKELKK